MAGAMSSSASPAARDEAAAKQGLEEALAAESRRLEKLWDAYKAQEAELQDALDRAKDLEERLHERDAAVREAGERADAAVAEKDGEIAGLRDEVSRLQAQVADLDALREEAKALEAYQNRVKELEDAYARERERLAKLYLVYEELEDEVKRLRGKTDES